MPAYCLKAMWCPDEDGAAVFVTYHDTDERHAYSWSFMLHGRVVVESNLGDMIHSGCGDEIDAMKSLAVLAGFLGAWCESLYHCARNRIPIEESENGTLFPPALQDWADEFGDDFEMWAHDYEYTEGVG